MKINYYCIEKDCNNEICSHTWRYGSGRCRTCAGKYHSIQMCGINNPNYGNPLNMKGENHPRYKDGKFLRKNYCMDCDKEIHPLARRCQICKQLGELNPNYIDGRSNEPYPLEFNDKLKLKIRKRDNYICQKCGITEEEHLIVYGRVLDVHHIDYDKQNCEEDNLTTLCSECNNRVNKNRKYWKEYFEIKIKEKK